MTPRNREVDRGDSVAANLYVLLLVATTAQLNSETNHRSEL